MPSPRAAPHAGDFDRDEMTLVEIEDFALKDMVKMLAKFDPNHTLLAAVSGCGIWGSVLMTAMKMGMSRVVSFFGKSIFPVLKSCC